jgi:Zn-dependent protease
MCQGGVLVNVVMFAFNMFPLPPLDGGRILVGLLPYRQAELVSRIEPWGFFIVMALVITNVISTLWMQPVMALTSGFINILLSPFVALVQVKPPLAVTALSIISRFHAPYPLSSPASPPPARPIWATMSAPSALRCAPA